MSDTVQLFLSGQVLPGFAPGEVATALARLLKVSETQAQAMLAGQETLIKRSLPRAQLAQYEQTLAKIGAETRVQTLEMEPLASSSADLPSAAQLDEAAMPMPPASSAAKPEVSCPACQTLQPTRTLCLKCGADMPRMRAAQAATAAEATSAPNTITGSAEPQWQPQWYVDSEIAATPAAFDWYYVGRLNRLRYMAYALLVLLPISLMMILLVFSASLGAAAWVLGLLAIATTAWFMLRIVVLRLHDLGLSGHWLWILVLVGLLMGLALPTMKTLASVLMSVVSVLICIWPGQREPNDYGPPNGPNHGWIIAGAVLYALLSLATLLADQPEEAEASSKAPGRLQAPLQIETSPDPVKQEALVRAAIDKAAKEQGVELDEVAREAAVQAYLRELQP